VFVFTAGDIRKEVPFSLGGFDRALIEAGGWLNYADERY
jgi:3-isopropylmalate/(R)-2-methylmalate dehydratase small subunit